MAEIRRIHLGYYAQTSYYTYKYIYDIIVRTIYIIKGVSSRVDNYLRLINNMPNLHAPREIIRPIPIFHRLKH